MSKTPLRKRKIHRVGVVYNIQSTLIFSNFEPKGFRMQIIRSIQNRIYEIRGERVILDRDLATLYGIETKVLNLAVKRNLERFPKDFMFQLTRDEFDDIRLEIDTIEKDQNLLRFQIETSNKRGGTRFS